MSPETPVSPTTTTEQNLTTKGQRLINIIWEVTQSLIACCVVFCSMAVSVHQGLSPTAHQEFPPVLSNALFLIVGFYFSRTNHAAIGGIGMKPQDKYTGR